MSAKKVKNLRVELLPNGIIRRDLELLMEYYGMADEWEVTIGERNDTAGGPSGDYAAATTIEEGYHSARIAIGSGWPESREDQFLVLAHELAHILFADYSIAVRRTCDTLKAREGKWMQQHFNREEELLCDRIARLAIRCLYGSHPVKRRR